MLDKGLLRKALLPIVTGNPAAQQVSSSTPISKALHLLHTLLEPFVYVISIMHVRTAF